MSWEVVIGLEIHAQLNTNSKIFSGSSIAYGNDANTQVSIVDAAMPGALPVLNRGVIDKAIKFGLAIGANIGRESIFARKNYFYPDLPKGYQISQFEHPIVDSGGKVSIEINGQKKNIRVTRAHLEEDAGKSLHDFLPDSTGIDLNRAGTPLLEIVSEPDLRSSQEAVSYTKKIHEMVQYLDICDGNMQEGSFRVDCNVSIHKAGTPYGTRAEIKNINSFRFIEQSIDYEINRQINILEQGKKVVQETRLFDSEKIITRSMRAKEEANDYRYFPDPDLLPVIVTDEQIEEIKRKMPELPDTKLNRFIKQYSLSEYDAIFLTASRSMADYFEVLISDVGTQHSKLCSNWVMGQLSKSLNQDNLNIDKSPVLAKDLAVLLKYLTDGTLSEKLAKQVFISMWLGEGTADKIIKEKGLKQITDTKEIDKIIDEVLANNVEQVVLYKAGQVKLFSYFVGQVMRLSKGQASPEQVNKLLLKRLK